MVFFDAASGEPLHPAAREALVAALEEGWAGPDRLYREGRRARMLLDAAREAVAEVLGARADEVAFTSSGTAAVHQAVLGLAAGRARAGRSLLVGAVEHSSVLHAAEFAARRGGRSRGGGAHGGGGDGSGGGEVVLVPADVHGRVTAQALTESLARVRAEGAAPAFVAVQSANHEVGTRQPLAALAEVCAADGGVPLLVDAAASLGREPVAAHWSVLAGSARKWGGPAGVGVLAVRTGTRFAADWPQDERERGRAPGPVNVPAVLAAATALRARAAEAQEVGLAQRELTALLRERIPALVPEVEVVGDPVDRLPHIVTFSCLYASGEQLLLELDRAGFAVSSGSSCTASTLTPSHVLEAMGVLSQGNVRVSLPWSVDRADVERFLEVLPAAVRAARPQDASVVVASGQAASPEIGSSSAPSSAAAADPDSDAPALEIDALGKLCPLPVIELARRIRDVPVGAVVRVLADDPAARLDIPAWCRMTGHDYLGEEPLGTAADEAAAGYSVRRKD